MSPRAAALLCQLPYSFTLAFPCASNSASALRSYPQYSDWHEDSADGICQGLGEALLGCAAGYQPPSRWPCSGTEGSAPPNAFPGGFPGSCCWPAWIGCADFGGDAGSEICAVVLDQPKTKHFPMLLENQKIESIISTTFHLVQSKIPSFHLFSSLQNTTDKINL